MIHHLMAVLTCIVASANAVSAGYLNASGPAPLRFHQPVVLAKPVLPPLPKDAPVTDFPIPAANESTNVTAVSASSASASPPAPIVITPQMLVDIFQGRRPGECGPETSVSVPLGFVPPPVGVGPSSHATYEAQ